MIETQRLYLRKYEITDVEVLYELCKDPDVGPDCGWMPQSFDKRVFLIKEFFQ